MFEWTEERVSFMADACERTDFHEKLAALLSPYLKRTDSVCDAGCGLGYLSLALSPLVGHVTAAERDDRALDVLRRQLVRRHIRNVTPLCTDVLAYTPSEPFDAMVSAQRETSRFQGGVVPSGHITKSFARTIDETRRMPASTAPFASAAAEVSRTGSVFRIPPAVTNGKTRDTVCSRHP